MVALKELGKWYAYDDSTERRTRAVQEARILARLNHPAIVRIHDVHPRVAMRILRHSKIAVTMEIGIAEAPSDATRDALRKLTDWLA
jgi:hypothetical protein